MLRGEIRLIELPPGLEGQENRTRPAVILTNDGANEAASRHDKGAVVVAPTTSSMDSVLPFQVPLSAEESGLERDIKVQVEQVRTISVERVGRLVGRVPPVRMRDIDGALRLHLGLLD